MKRLERKWARVCILLIVLTILCMFIPLVVYCFAGAVVLIWMQIGMIGAVLCLAAAVVLRVWHLSCPNCGRGIAPVQWKPGKRYYCSLCGKPFLYDDEPDEPPEAVPDSKT